MSMTIRPTGKRKRVSIGSGTAAVLFCFLFIPVPKAQASDIELGLLFGSRQIADGSLNGIYGGGIIFRPQLRWAFHPHFAIEAAYETGYKKDGLVGFYRERSTLIMNAVEAALVFRSERRGFVPFIKAGLGYYGYTQRIESEFVRQRVDHHGIAPFAGAGLELAILRGLYLSGAVHYVPLKVKPYDIEVDLSGVRVLIGLNFRLGY